jgi:hypothetical protein
VCRWANDEEKQKKIQQNSKQAILKESLRKILLEQIRLKPKNLEDTKSEVTKDINRLSSKLDRTYEKFYQKFI